MAQNSQSKQNPSLLVKEIQDVYMRRNFQNLQDFFGAQNQMLDFKFFEVVFTAAQANKKVAHGLNVIPQDILVSKITGSGSVTFNTGLFDGTNMDLTASGPCRVRFFAGTYWNYLNSTQSTSTDGVTYSSGQSVGKQVYSATTIPSGKNPAQTSNQYQVLLTDDTILLSSTGIPGLSIRLPTLASSVGRVFTFIKVSNDTQVIGINTNNQNELFTDGTSSTLVNMYQERLQVYNDGTAWRVLVQELPNIACSYTSTDGTALTTGLAVLKFNSKTYDPFSLYNPATGFFTAPCDGLYAVTCMITASSVLLSTSQYIELQAFKNGSLGADLDLRMGTGATSAYRCGGTGYILCAKGDTIAIYGSSGVATTLYSATSGKYYSHVDIMRVGNSR